MYFKGNIVYFDGKITHYDVVMLKRLPTQLRPLHRKALSILLKIEPLQLPLYGWQLFT